MERVPPRKDLNLSIAIHAIAYVGVGLKAGSFHFLQGTPRRPLTPQDPNPKEEMTA